MSAHREQILDFTRTSTLRPRDAGREWVLFLVSGYLLITAMAVFAMRLPGVGVRGQEMSIRRCVFAAVNATTLTGFQQDAGSVLPGAELLRLGLTIAGTLFTLIAGGMAVSRIARMGYSDGQVARASLIAVVAATIGGAVFLLDSENGARPAMLQAASAVGNSGLYAGRLPEFLDWRAHAVLMPLAVAGGLGMPVLMELFDRITGARRLSKHTSRVIVLSAIVYLAGMALIVLLDTAPKARNPAAPEAELRMRIALASTLALDARTAGFPFEFASAISRPAQWVLIALMIVGGSPGGSAGGVKTTTIWRLIEGVRANLSGRPLTRGFGIAACWVGLYFTILTIGFFLLLHTEPDIGPDRLLFLAVSAVSNVGLSHDPVSIAGNGLLTLSAMMMAGRLAPLFVLWWMASRAEDELVAVG